MIAKKRHYSLTLACRFAIFYFRCTGNPCFFVVNLQKAEIKVDLRNGEEHKRSSRQGETVHGNASEKNFRGNEKNG